MFGREPVTANASSVVSPINLTKRILAVYKYHILCSIRRISYALHPVPFALGVDPPPGHHKPASSDLFLCELLMPYDSCYLAVLSLTHTEYPILSQSRGHSTNVSATTVADIIRISAICVLTPATTSNWRSTHLTALFQHQCIS